MSGEEQSRSRESNPGSEGEASVTTIPETQEAGPSLETQEAGLSQETEEAVAILERSGEELYQSEVDGEGDDEGDGMVSLLLAIIGSRAFYITDL